MKTKREIEDCICDVCGVGGCYHSCASCGKDFCYDCRKTHAKEYGHGVYFIGSGDIVYCLECDAKLKKVGDKRQRAYLEVERLRNEYTGWMVDFDRRKKEAEEAVKKFQTH